MIPEFTNYKDASDYQLQQWVIGKPWHNPWSPVSQSASQDRHDGECCPDFSCCVPEMIWAEYRRVAFVNSDEETRVGMLFGGLSQLISDHDAVVISGHK